ncbi:MAG TPA: low molecular weight protein-tyrosine-phosphatase [Gammaproteobacteria bacterium]|nr:low molecular weight protein-tyrosine-phosphatase [Gammaproteobacteria bacterium]
MNDPTARVRVLFVCMGNICRSPTAEAVFRHLVREAGLEGIIAIDSAGTHGYHIGSSPDARATEAARRRGYELESIRARQLEPEDLTVHDYVVAMDRDNLAVIERLADAGGRAQTRLLMHYGSGGGPDGDVPDPYYGARNGFEEVLDLVEMGTAGLLSTIRRTHSL